MWFDPRAALAEIRAAAPVANPQPGPDPGANRAKRAKRQTEGVDHLAHSARLARPRHSEPKTAPMPGGASALLIHDPAARPAPAPSAPAVALHGGMVRLGWSGEWVSRDRWEVMSDFERHGPQGRLFCGKCRDWRDRATALACLDGETCQ